MVIMTKKDKHARTKICGLTEQDYGPVPAIMLFLWRELSETKRDKDFVSLVRLDKTLVVREESDKYCFFLTL